MTILYTPREMLAMTEQKPRPDNFLRGRFIRQEVFSDKKFLEIDKVIGSQAKAAYSARAGGPTVVDKTGYSTLLHVAPYVYEAIPFSAADLDTREAGDTIYGSNAASSLAMKTSGWVGTLEDRLNRLEEAQLASALTSGTVVVSGDGTSYTVDYGMPSGHKVTNSGDDVWGTTTAIMAQLTEWSTFLSNKGYVATDLIMDPTAAALLLNDTTIATKLNNFRLSLGQVNPTLVAGQRASYLGNLAFANLNIDLWSYNGGYETAAGTFVNYLGTYRAIMVAGQQLDCRAHYGKIENLKSGSFIGRRFPNMYIQEDGRQGFVTLESAPLMAIHNPEAVVSALVVS